MARLFEPLEVAGLRLANRIVIAPMCQYSAEDGAMTDWHQMHLGQLALSGAGALTIEATAVSPEGRITYGDVGLYDDRTEAAMRSVLESVRRWSDMPLIIQLAHAGRKASCAKPWHGGAQLPPDAENGWQTVAPSAIPFAPDDHPPVELDKSGLARIREAFAHAARRAGRLGIDAVQIHAAHGYLLHAFLSPISNQRGDEYGGSLDNRMRFPLEVFDAVREAFPADRPVTVRVSGTDWVEGGWTAEETALFAQELERRGCAAIHVSSGGLDPRQQIPVGPGYQVPLARTVKDAVAMPVVAVGMITDPHQAERIFVNFPQWGDNAPFTVAELVDGKAVPYPDAATNRPDPADPAGHFISVQSVVADGANRLWVLDTAAPKFSQPQVGGAKLVAIDLATDRVVKTIVLPPSVVLPTTYLNDVRFDLRQGAEGVAYITDSSNAGVGGIIVVDIASGRAIRRLSNHATTNPEPGFTPVVDGAVLMNRPADGPATPVAIASDAIALSADGSLLYYGPLSGRTLHAAPTAMLRDPAVSEEELARAVRSLGRKGASDGIAEDDRGRVFAGDYENNAIRVLDQGRWTTLVSDPRISWPDTLSIGTDGYLYFTANQLHRQPGFHGGRDLRRKPYELLRIRVGAGPVLLRSQ